jgi:hypothetical protein
MKNYDEDRRGIRASSESADFLLEFDTPAIDFHRGFQCGEIWACLVDQVPEIQAIVSAENSEMIMRMTSAANYQFEGRYLTQSEIDSLELGPGEWMTVVMRLTDGE